MGAEEVMCRFAMDLSGNAEEGEELVSVKDPEDRRIEVNHAWTL